MRPLVVLLLAALLPLAAPAQTVKSGNVHHRRIAKPVRPPVVAPEPLTPEALQLAEKVFVGQLPCELGASVTLSADAEAPGYFHLQLGRQRFHMAPVATTTGAVRLEDHQAGTVWLQLANKSMLVSDRLGRRLVDACMNPDQVLTAQALENNPVPTVLDDPAPTPQMMAAPAQAAAVVSANAIE